VTGEKTVVNIRRNILIAAGVLALAFVGSPLIVMGSLNDAATTVPEIHIKNFSFGPALLKVKAGTAVTWINDDEEPHNVVNVGMPTRVFRSGGMDGEDRYSFTFETPGTYQYICSVHPYMHGEVVVQ
jgi:amicyanin